MSAVGAKQTRFRAILETGVQARASDWHIRQDAPVVLRVDAQLAEVADFIPDEPFLKAAVGEICDPMFLAKFDETGDADFSHHEDGVGRFRVNLHRQRGMMALTFRHIKDKIPNLDALGLPPAIERIAQTERGIVLVTGTTGSGKSTTMACMLEYMNSNYGRHILTIEDPIEYHFADRNSIFEQREVGLDTCSFDSALVHALRQDPDVIMVGEMRNRDSFDTALTAAETGHMVVSTMHTSNAPQTIQRILDFYPHEEREQILTTLSSSLNAIICQRLLPRAVGRGVVPALEILVNTPVMRELISRGKLEQVAAVIEAGANDGMISFNQSLVNLVNEGLITENLAIEKATNADMLRMNLRGIYVSTGGGLLG